MRLTILEKAKLDSVDDTPENVLIKIKSYMSENYWLYLDGEFFKFEDIEKLTADKLTEYSEITLTPVLGGG